MNPTLKLVVSVLMYLFKGNIRLKTCACLLFLLCGCFPTKSVKKVLSQGLEIQPNSSVMIIWEHEKMFPLSELIMRSVEDEFIIRNVKVYNFHEWDVQQALQIKPQIRSSVSIDEIKRKMNVDYLFRFYVDRLIEGEDTEYYLPEFNAFFFEPDERYASHLYVEVISIEYESLFAKYRSIATESPIALPARGGGAYNFNFGNLRSTTLKAAKNAVQKILKNHYHY